MNPQKSKSTLTEQEMASIKEELAAIGITDSPDEQQLSALRNLLSNDKVSPDLAIFLKEKIFAKPKEESNELLTPVVDNRHSMFKQFAQTKVEGQGIQKEYVCKSKRKVKPTEPFQRHSLEEAVRIWDDNTTECHSLFEKRGRKGFSGFSLGTLNQNCLWNFHEQFYSSLDRQYLREETFKRLLHQMEISYDRMTYFDHRMVRQALPVPKVFGSEFINSELQKLAQIRLQARLIPKQKGRDSDLSVGKEVIALHPVCGHLHTGSILAIYKQNQFMVKFQRPQLGTQKVIDSLMSPREISSHQRIVIQNVDYEVMALAIRLLQYKTELIELMRQYNENALSRQRSQNPLDNIFFQQYGWIGSTINILSLGIKHVISKFRFRGLSNANQQKVGKHFASILINPLNLMEKELDKSSENSDHYASKQIKQIINTHKETRTEQLTKQFFSKIGARLNDSELEDNQKEEMEKLLKAMIGLLVNLRYECRNFSLESNKYLNELMNTIDNRYPEHFNEIYETLHSITSKISEQIK